MCSDFIHHYQKTLFKENEVTGDNFAKSNYKRQCTYQILHAAQSEFSNETTCHILKMKLQEYSSAVDRTDGVNNYADGVLELVSNNSYVSDSQTWTSEARGPDLLKEFLKHSEGECHHKTPKGCEAQKPSYNQLCNFLKNKRHLQSSIQTVNKHNDKPMILQTVTETNTQPISSPGFMAKPQTYKRTSGEESKLQQTGSRVMNVIESRVFRPNHNKSSAPSAQPQYTPSFRTAGTVLQQQNAKKGGGQAAGSGESATYGTNKKSLGGRPRSVNSKFVAPVKSTSQEDMEESEERQELEDERLRLIDPKLVDLIRSEIMDRGPPVHWDHIAGLTFAKATIQEIVVLPMLRPDIFTGLRRPPKGILLFGPPGTGKTLIGKCIASQSKSTFFNISASSLTSKWVGEGEKMVRTLFTLARVHQPAVVFIDEIDSLLSQRSETEHESSRRIKTEFLVQLDGAGTGEEDRILVIGATNRPQELDEAARRRLVKRLYIPLPDHPARCQMVQTLMSSERHELTQAEIEEVAGLTDGYSGADMKTLCQEACLGPIRALSFSDIQHITPDQVRPVTIQDFKSALQRVRSSVSPKDLEVYTKWDETYGSGGAPKL